MIASAKPPPPATYIESLPSPVAYVELYYLIMRISSSSPNYKEDSFRLSPSIKSSKMNAEPSFVKYLAFLF